MSLVNRETETHSPRGRVSTQAAAAHRPQSIDDPDDLAQIQRAARVLADAVDWDNGDAAELLVRLIIKAYNEEPPKYPTDNMIRALRMAAGLDPRNTDEMDWDRDRQALAAALEADPFWKMARFVADSAVHNPQGDVTGVISQLIDLAKELELI